MEKVVQTRESLVLEGTGKIKLRYYRVSDGFTLYSVDKTGKPDKVYQENVDYVLDRQNGYIWRTENSTIPDYATHGGFGKGMFTLQDFGGKYENGDFMVYADYTALLKGEKTTQQYANIFARKRGDYRKLSNSIQAGEEIEILIFGDSISCGGEAQDPANIYYNRLAAYLEKTYGCKVTLTNKSKAGYNTEEVREHFEEYVKGDTTDFLILAFGMNDQNVFSGENPVTPEIYGNNLRYYLENVTCRKSAILLSPCKPNPFWNHSSKRLQEYVFALEQLAEEYGLPFANVTELWQSELDCGKRPRDLLNNNVNHPTDYGHYVYFTAFQALFSGEEV